MTALLLDGKTCLITGAGRGFGAGIALGMAQAGAKVCITDINVEELQQTVLEIEAAGGEVLPLVADVSDFAAMQDVVAQIVDKWGRLDAVICNAAIMPLVPFTETTPALWNKIIGVTMTGVYNTVKAAWDQLVAQGGGHCMAIASGASLRGFVDEVAYCTAKHGLEGFSKALAMEAEPVNIAVNTMGPGKRIKPTNITRAEYNALPTEERAAWVDPVDLAPAFVWLAAQPPSRFTGLRFDAGPLADTIAAEGYDFDFAPEKVTLYVADLVERMNRREKGNA